MTGWRRRFALGFGALVLFGGLAVLTAVQLVSVGRDLRRADDLLERAADALTAGRLADAQTTLADAERLVLSANETLRGSPVLDVIELVPVLGSNLRSLQDSVALAAVVTHGGIRILDASTPLQGPDGTLEVSLADGSIPLAAVTKAEQEIDLLQSQLVPLLRSDQRSFVIGPVQDVNSQVRDEAARRSQQLDVLGEGLSLLRHLAGGDGNRRYLIAVANTAEMRGSGGMILNYGVLEGREGKIDLTAFGRVDELGLTTPVSDSLVPADYLARWSGFDPLSRMRQATLAGDFTVTAPVLEAMYTRATGLPVHGVMQVDPEGLAAILEGVGPVVVPEVGEVTAANVVSLTLHDAYILFPDVEERTDVLGDVAEAAFTRLVDGDFPSLRPLAESIAEAVEGRHILMHATSSDVQSTAVAFGADGGYPSIDGPDAFALTAQNLGGHKLDYYLDTSIGLTGRRHTDEVGVIDAEITLSNTAPVGATDPAYIFGPGVGGLPAGLMRSVVTLYLPFGTSVAEVVGDAPVEPLSTGTEDGRPYASFIMDVPASESRTVRISLQLAPRPEGDYELLLVPSPRIRPTIATTDISTGTGTIRGTVTLDRTWSLEAGSEPTPLLAPVYR